MVTIAKAEQLVDTAAKVVMAVLTQVAELVAELVLMELAELVEVAVAE
jgi:hypothetical protein